MQRPAPRRKTHKPTSHYTARLAIRITPERKEQLKEHAARLRSHGYTMTDIVEWGLSAVMDDEAYFPLMFRRQDRIQAEVGRNSKRIKVLSEMLFLFLQDYLVASLALQPPKHQLNEARSKAAARFQKFLKALDEATAKEGYLDKIDRGHIEELVEEAADTDDGS